MINSRFSEKLNRNFDINIDIVRDDDCSASLSVGFVRRSCYQSMQKSCQHSVRVRRL